MHTYRGDELFTVGHYDPNGEWQAMKDFDTEEEAARYVNYLNGGRGWTFPTFGDRWGSP